MINETPYRYLKLPNNPLIDSWREKVPDFKKVFLYSDQGCNLLKPELKQIFLNCGLNPFMGNLWSWEPNNIPKFYHTDQKVKPGIKRLECSLNWLVQGEPGITEWSYSALDKVSIGLKGNSYKTDAEWWGTRTTPSEFSAILNKPMLIRVDVPHRVNTTGVMDYRISYSVRFENKPNWLEVIDKLKDYIE
jgi:hypothetical protein